MRIGGPLFFERVLKQKIWGGRNLSTLFEWKIPEGQKIGESWEISDVPGEESRVLGGHFPGKTLRELMQSSGKEILGHSHPGPEGRFPLLLKFLDTTDLLSVQVHPDDATAKKLGDGENGKTEAWYFLSTPEGHPLSVGLKPGTDAAMLRNAIQHSQLPSFLENITVKPGEAVLVPAGLVHAMGPGFTLVEVQQTSDITYRLYDWDRVGDDGKPRALHVDKGIQATNFSLARPEPQRPRWRRPTRGFREGQLLSCPYFKISLGEVESEVGLRTPNRPVLLVATQGYGEIGWGAENKRELDPGQTCLVPASLTEYRLNAVEGKFNCLMIEPGPF